MKEFNNISKKEMVSSGVRSLPDRPNAYSKYGAGALTAAQLKEAFDKLAELVAGRVNDIFSSLKDGTFSDYVKPPDLLTEVGVDSLGKLLEGLLTGEFADVMQVESGVSLKHKLAQLAENEGYLQDDIESIKGRTVDQLSYDALTGRLTITSTDGTSHYIDLPLEVTVDSGYYDGEERCIVIKLTSGDEVRIPVDDLDAEAFESRLEEISRASATKAGLRDAVVVNGEVRYPSEGLEYEKDEYGLTYTVVGLGTCEDKNIVVPRTYNGLPVTAIGENAFESQIIDSINLFEIIEFIGAGAFEGCSNLRFVYVYSKTPIIAQNRALPLSVQGVFVPLHSVESYKINAWWSPYAEKIVAIETFESVNTTIVNMVNMLQQVDANIVAQMNANVGNLVAVDTNLQTMIENEQTARAKQDEAVLALCTQTIQNVQQQMVNVVVNEQNERVKKDKDLQEQINGLKGENGYSEGLVYLDIGGARGVSGIGTCADTEIRIPPTADGSYQVLLIATEAFVGNADITSVILPDTMQRINSRAFMNCSNLKSVTLNDGLQSIEKAAFANCTSLESVVIPSSVTVIAEGAFDSCANLKTVTFNGVTPPTITEYTFYNTNVEEYRVPSTALETYRTAEGWSVYADKLVPYDTLETLRADIDELKANGGGGNYDEQIADLQSQIDTEKANREAQDNAVLNAAAAAIQQNTANLVAVIGDEQTARANKDNDLQAQIDAINATISEFVNVAEVGA